MSIVFQCSVRKANWKKEKAILVEAGLMTEWQDNTWVRYRELWNGYWRLTAEDSFTNSTNLIISAKQMASIVALHKLNPSLTERDLVKTLKLNQRNRYALKLTQYRDLAE